MAILLKHEIIENIQKQRITSYGNQIEIDSIINQIGVNSVDVTLGSILKTYVDCKNKVDKLDSEFYLDMKKQNEVHELIIPEEGLILMPGILYLGYTNEGIGSKYHIPMYEGRSSMARLGIQSHISAGFGDIGFDAQWTLEITVIHPVKIYPNIKIGQVFFMKIDKEESIKANKMGGLYNGKYKKQVGVQESKSFEDFK